MPEFALITGIPARTAGAWPSFCSPGATWARADPARERVNLDPRYLRPTEVELLKADSSNVTRQRGWEARVQFSRLIRIMVDAELKAAGMPDCGEDKLMLTAWRVSWLKRP